MFKNGVLTKLDLAFSRDQAEKIYVQHRMAEHAKELWSWLEEGAHFYVCGDAKRMAKDVDAALHELIQTAGGKTKEQATEYVAALKSAKRYQRDVY
jgi:sulfite reductase (NADPH) flavoprotein alpha-component